MLHLPGASLEKDIPLPRVAFCVCEQQALASIIIILFMTGNHVWMQILVCSVGGLFVTFLSPSSAYLVGQHPTAFTIRSTNAVVSMPRSKKRTLQEGAAITKRRGTHQRNSGMSRKRTAIQVASFRATSTGREAQSLTDGVQLAGGVILPWIGYGTYKLGKTTARELTLEALKQGYRCIDTAFIYGGETTETQVGLAIQDAMDQGILERQDLVLQTKHWRKYHGYEPTLQCLNLSLKRLQLNHIDVWLMHWPGPAWTTMTRRKDDIAEHGPWHYAVTSQGHLPALRSETWRAMETALQEGKVKAIGVSNFSVAHLKRLKETATVWPPAVNQIECHPLYPQSELLEYCKQEGIVVQAYASLGGQDAGKTFWKKVYPPKKGAESVTKLLNTPPVSTLSKQVERTPAQVLLRWALEKNLTFVPKSSSPERMVENANIFDFCLTKEQMNKLETQLVGAVSEAAKREGEDASVQGMARLCWRNDPLRLLDFD